MNREKAQPIIGIVLCVLFFLAYNQYINKKYPKAPPPPAAETAPGEPQAKSDAAPSGAPSLDKPADAPPANRKLSATELVLENSDVIMRFDQELGAIASIRLKHYKRNRATEDFVELLDSPMTVRGIVAAGARPSPQLSDGTREGNSLTFTRQLAGWKVVERYTLPPAGYDLKIETSFTNGESGPQEFSGGLWLGESIIIPSSGPSLIPGAAVASHHQKFVVALDSSIKTSEAKSHCEDADSALAFTANSEKVNFAGLDMHYFLTVVRPNFPKVDLRAQGEPGGGGAVCPVAISLTQRSGSVAPGETVKLDYSSFFGPKDIKQLEAVEPLLGKTVDFGWFTIFAYPLLVAVKGFQKVTQNYGVAIILMTALLKILFYPLTKAAAVSMKRMQKLQPEMQRIREKYADEPQRQQQELMKFMTTNKVNPAKGCLPILPQIPVFIAFYNVLSQAIELRHAPFALWIKDLAAADPYYVSPLVLGGLMFLQQRLTPTPGMDKAQQRILMMMPIMFTVMMLSLPAGMVIYMITNTIISIAQQQWLNKKLA